MPLILYLGFIINTLCQNIHYNTFQDKMNCRKMYFSVKVGLNLVD